MKFQGVPRQVLNSVLPPAGASISVPKSATKPVSNATPRPDKQKVVAIQAPKSVAVTPASNNSSGSSRLGQALAIIADQIGLDMSELSDQSAFADLGVDSLLSLTIAGRLREELDMDIESSLFMECPTVKGFKEFFSQHLPVGNGSPDHAVISLPEVSSSTDSATQSVDSESTFSDDRSVTTVEDDDDIMTSIRLTIAGEIGISPEELTGSSDLADLGMDSLMSLTVLGKLRETLSIDLSSDLFAENTTLDAIEATLGIKPKPVEASVRSEKIRSPTERRSATNPMPVATSILLQGNPKTARKSLFLFPDGSGSSTSYAPLSRIGSDIAVYGLNCPFMKTPQDLTYSLDEITRPYLAEIRRRQPRGPYYFGGWSAGGICAYDAAQQVLKQGEEVARLIFIDSPCPIGLEKLPPRLYDFFNSISLFGTGDKAPPEWLFPHFLAFIDSLDAYKAVPFAPGKAPKTHMIWARDGVCKFPEDPRPERRPDDPREMTWLLENRTNFGPNGWDQLLGQESLVIETMSEANHFTMMEGEKAKELSEFIGRAMA